MYRYIWPYLFIGTNYTESTCLNYPESTVCGIITVFNFIIENERNIFFSFAQKSIEQRIFFLNSNFYICL